MTVFRLSPYRALVLEQGTSLAFFAGDIVGGVQPEARRWSSSALYGGAMVPFVGGPAGLAFAAVGDTGGFEGVPLVGIPLGHSPRRLDVLCRIPTLAAGLIELAGWGDGPSRFSVSYAASSATVRVAVGQGTVMSVPVVADGTRWTELSLYMDADGWVAITIDGVRTAADAPVAPPDDDPQASFRVLRSAPAGFAFACACVAAGPLSALEVAERRQVLDGAFHLAGHAALDGGPPVNRVLVRRMPAGTLLADITPASDFSFDVPVPAGDYDVSCYGPETYLPELVGPLAAQPVAP